MSNENFANMLVALAQWIDFLEEERRNLQTQMEKLRLKSSGGPTRASKGALVNENKSIPVDEDRSALELEEPAQDDLVYDNRDDGSELEEEARSKRDELEPWL